MIVVGSTRDGERMGPVLDLAASHPMVRSLVGETDVPTLVALIARAGIVFANDSGPMHMADALRRPMVILYSGTEHESQWSPRFAPSMLLREPTHCTPCHRFVCPYHMECLDIAPARVVDAALQLLGQPAEDGERLVTKSPSGERDQGKGKDINGVFLVFPSCLGDLVANLPCIPVANTFRVMARSVICASSHGTSTAATCTI